MAKDKMELIPEGRYEAKLVEADMTHDPRYPRRLKLRFEINEGPQKGRPLWIAFGVDSNPTLLVDVKHRDRVEIDRDDKPPLTLVFHAINGLACGSLRPAAKKPATRRRGVRR